jgi:sec-independent protein translocase protein TatA
MNTLFAAMLGGWEIILILAVVLILFGAKKLPELAKGLGQGIKEFKKATTEVSNEMHSAMDDNRYSNPRHIEQPSHTKPVESQTAPSSTPSNKA